MADTIVIDLDIDNGKAVLSLGEIENKAQKTSKEAKKSFSSLGSSLGSTATKAGLLASAIGGIASALVFKESIQAAIKQENAVNQLNTSLKLAGSFSEEASRSFQDFASELQRTTTFGDETTLQFAALARNFTKTNEEAQKLTAAAIDLSAATGLSLESSVKNLGKTFAGLTGELGESVPALRNLTAEQLKAGAAIDLITKRFGGAAAAQLKTFSGAVTALGNNFGDLLEEVGFLVTKSPVVITLVNDLSKQFQRASKAVQDFASNPENINNLITQLAGVGQGFIKFVVAPSELALRAVEVFTTSGITLLLRFRSAAATVDKGLGKIANFFNEGSGDKLIQFSNDIDTAFKSAEEASKRAEDNIFNFSTADKLSTSLDDVRAYFIELNSIQDQQKIIQNERSAQQLSSLTTLSETLGNTFSVFSTKVADDFKLTQDQIQASNDSIKKFSLDAGKNLRTGLAQGAGNAFAQFGAALAKGENAIEAFGKALLQSIGQQAVALGTRFILEGTAISFNPILGGPAVGVPLIKAGAALAVFGGALGASSGGGATSSQGGAPTGAFAAGETTTDTEIASPEAVQERGPSVQLIVQGDVLDSDETGTRLLDILNKNFETGGGSFTGASFA